MLLLIWQWQIQSSERVTQLHTTQENSGNKLHTTQEGPQPKFITTWLEEQTWNSIRMLKSTKMKNASHNTNYLLLYSRFKFPQRSHIHFIAGKLKLCRLSQKYKLNTKTWKNLKNLKDCLLTRVGKVCSITKSSWVCHNKTYWWSNAVNYAHKEKQHEWKQWELGENNEEYHFVKRAAACVVYDVKQPVQSEYFRDI